MLIFKDVDGTARVKRVPGANQQAKLTEPNKKTLHCTAPQKLELKSNLWGVCLWLNIVKNSS
jgi:hypothetical protein